MAYVPPDLAEPGHRGRDRRARQAPPRPDSFQAPLRTEKGELTLADANYPDDLLYHDQHDWARLEGDEATLRDHLVRPGQRSARSSSTTRPRSARRSTKDASYAEVESVKAVSDVIAPMSGEIVEVNDALDDAPEKINEDPYGEGWLVKVKLTDAGRGRGAARRRGIPQAAGHGLARPRHRASVALAVVTRYTSATAADRAEMLAAIGVDSVDELFEQIPEPLRLGRPLELPDGLERGRGLRAPGGAGRRATPTPRSRSASSAPGCTTTTCRRSSTRSPSAPSSSPRTRPTSRRSRRAGCR